MRAVSRRPWRCRQRPQPTCDCAAPASAAVNPALYSMPTWRHGRLLEHLCCGFTGNTLTEPATRLINAMPGAFLHVL